MENVNRWYRYRVAKKSPGRAAKVLGAVEFARQRLGFDPDPLQATVLESRHGRGILNCSRQWGKSTVTVAKAIHRAYTEPDRLVLVASPSGRQSGEYLEKAERLMRRAGIAVKGDGYNELSLRFPNGSRIVGVPGAEGTVRGFSSVSLMLIDEAARVSEEMYQALRPMLAVGRGELWLMSTPLRKRGFFYEAWEHGGPDWFRVRATAQECPRIDQGMLDEELELMGEERFRREYMCEFEEDGADLFDRELLERAIDPDVKQLVF